MSMLPMEPRPRRGLFGRGFDLPDTSMIADPTMVPVVAPKVGLLDKIGLAGDILTGRNITSQRLEQQSEPYRRAAQLQQQQAAQFATWTAQQEYEAAHPKPAAPHYFKTNDGSLAMIDQSTGQPKVLYKDPTPKMQYITAKDPTTGQTIITPVPMTGASGPPPGVTFTPIDGGAGPTAPRTFR